MVIQPEENSLEEHTTNHGGKPNFKDFSTLELQQVADWKHDVIQFKLRYGSLAKDQALYVYIMNEGGLYNSAGFKILSN